MIVRRQKGSKFRCLCSYDVQRLVRMDTAIAVRSPFPVLIHSEHLGILAEEFARQKLRHRMDLMLDMYSIFAAVFQKHLATLRLDEFKHLLLVLYNDNIPEEFLGFRTQEPDTFS